MKGKKFALLGLVAISIGISVLFPGASVHADAATDAKAKELIAKCKTANGALSPDAACREYDDCIQGIIGGVLYGNDTVCQSVLEQNGNISDAAANAQAKALIAFCKPYYAGSSATNPGPGGFKCSTYNGCIRGDLLNGDNIRLCKLVKKLDAGVKDCTKGTVDEQYKCSTVQTCVATVKTEKQCSDAYDKCLKLNAGKEGECAVLIAKGDLAAAGKKIPDAEVEGKTKCQVDGVGWIVCPVMNFLSLIVDGAYTIVSALLEVQPLLTTGETANIYNAWSFMRNFANVAFVIAFLVIIFSQLSSVGLNNYGIKKMLPRLIVAAILVNISYWVCAIAVDASNVAGVSIKDLFDGLEASLALPDSAQLSDKATGEGWAGITGGLLAGTVAVGAALYIGLAALLPVLIAALLAIVTTFLVLTLRQALIILLVIISPLAFVAYLLPNTESWFKKWRDLLQTLLMMYPIISFVFGASALASQVVMNSAPAGDGAGDEGQKVAIQIMGAGIAIIPLAITPIIMKSAGGVLNRFGGIVNNPNKGPFDRLRKGAEGYRANREEYRDQKALNGYRSLPGRRSKVERGLRREAVLSTRKSELARAKSSYVAGTAESDEAFRAKLAQGGGEGADMRALAGAISVQADLETKEVKAASAVIDHMNLSSSQLNDLAKGQDITMTMPDGQTRTLRGGEDATRKAAINQAVATGTVKDIESLLTDSAPRTESQNKILSSAIASSGITKKATHLGGRTLDDISQGRVNNTADLDAAVARNINDGKYSAEVLAGNDTNSLERVRRVAQAGHPGITNAARIGELQAESTRALDPTGRIRGTLTPAQRAQLEGL